MNKDEVILLKNFLNKTPGWDYFIQHINKSFYRADMNVRDQIHTTVGAVHFWSRLTLTVDDAFIKPYTNTLLQKLEELYGDKSNAPFSIISFTTKEKTTGKHNDPVDVFYWQCIGSAKWKVEGHEDYILNPGDVIYIPNGTLHEVESLTPRAAISTTFEPSIIRN